MINGDCLEVMRGMEAHSVSAIVTDPPYGLHFMGKDWDTFKFKPAPSKNRNLRSDESHVSLTDTNGAFQAGNYDDRRNDEFQEFIYNFAVEALRVVKPGGHLLMFGAPRRYHRQACGIEDAGWEIRDCLMWIYGSGFPKSLNIGKSLDKKLDGDIRPICRFLNKSISDSGMSIEDIASKFNFTTRMIYHWAAKDTDSQPRLPSNEQWNILKGYLNFSDEMDSEVKRLNERENAKKRGFKEGNLHGWFTGKELLENPQTALAKQFDGFGTALKPAYEPIILAMKPCDGTFAKNAEKWGQAGLNIDVSRIPTFDSPKGSGERKQDDIFKLGGKGNGGNITPSTGRWPANILLDEEAVELLDRQSGHSKSSSGVTKAGPTALGQNSGWNSHNNKPTEHQGHGDSGGASRFFYCAKASSSERGQDNRHPTVKPIRLMEYLIRLIAPPKDAVIVDPFAGSGTTLLACQNLGLTCIGIEKSSEYCAIAQARIDANANLFSKTR